MLKELLNVEKIFGFCEKLCYFLAVNILFLVCCTPVLLFFLFIGISNVREYLPLFLLSMLSVPPAFCAVLYSMRRFLDERERGAWKDYWKGYRTDFMQKLTLGAGQLLAVFILWTNVEFFTKQMPLLPLALVFILLFAFVIILTPNLYLLASRYKMNNISVARTACILTVTRPACTLGSTAALAAMMAVFELAAGTAVLFIVSIYGFLVVYMSRKILEVLEKGQ